MILLSGGTDAPFGPTPARAAHE